MNYIFKTNKIIILINVVSILSFSIQISQFLKFPISMKYGKKKHDNNFFSKNKENLFPDNVFKIKFCVSYRVMEIM